ncbi:MAG: polysaccharide biosynthesis C-terminal domain-containing protein [Chitinophagaceae bacterium]
MKLLKSSFWFRSIFFTLLQRFSLVFFGVVSFIILVRGLGDHFSVWVLYLTTLTLMETIKQGLLRNPTIKFLNMPEFAELKNEVQSSAIALNVAFSILAIAVLLLFGTQIAHWLKSPDLAPLLWWSFTFLTILIPYSHCEVMLQAHYQFSRIFWAYFVRQALFFIGIAVLYFFRRDLFTPMSMLVLQVISLAVGAVIMYFACRPWLTKRFHYNAAITKKMFYFGRYIFGTNLFFNISRSLDRYMTANILDALNGSNYVKYYETVGRVNNLIDVPSLAAADVLFPKNAEASETDGIGKVKYYFERMVGIILALIIPISLFVFLFPSFIIWVLAGKGNEGAVSILQITILFSIVRPLSYQFGSTLDAIGKPQVNFRINVLFMLLNLALNYFFLKNFGPMGAAYATIINYILTFVIMMAVLKKYIAVETGNILRYMVQTYKDILGMVGKMKGKLSN